MTLPAHGTSRDSPPDHLNLIGPSGGNFILRPGASRTLACSAGPAADAEEKLLEAEFATTARRRVNPLRGAGIGRRLPSLPFHASTLGSDLLGKRGVFRVAAELLHSGHGRL